MDWQRLVNDVKSALAKWPNHPGLKLLGKQLGVN